MKTKTKSVVTASMLAALICIATMIIKVPSPLKGYVNLGDSVVLFAGFSLSPLFGFLAAGIGSALADIFLGYVVYAPATFIIKGLMATTAFFLYRFLKPRFKTVISAVTAGIAAEAVMVLGYYIFEGFLYGFIPSLVNIPANTVQGAFGIVISVALLKIFEKKII